MAAPDGDAATHTPRVIASPNPTTEPATERTTEPAPEVTIAPVPISFTYDCYVEMPNGTNPTGTTAPFSSWEEVWAVPDIQACKPVQHGTEWTDVQREVVEIVRPAFAPNVAEEEMLAGAYIACAITDTPYLKIGPIDKANEPMVRGMLTLCPDRPGAAELAARLPG